MASAEIEYRCFVRGLAWATDNEALERAFSQYGEIIESKIINDCETGRSRGFGFITFGNEQAMRDAIEAMNGQNLDGRNITVNEAQSRGSGGDGGGGGYSRGGDGGEKLESLPAVQFKELFRFADGLDYVLMAIGSVGAVVHGSSLPIFLRFFADLVNSFGANAIDMDKMMQKQVIFPALIPY